MILNEREVLSCLIYICETMYESKIKINEVDLSISEKIVITGKVIYDYQPLDISASFLLDYKDGQIYIYDIVANVEYLVFKLNFMNLVKHVLKDYPVIFTSDSIAYTIKLPIDKIVLSNQKIEINIK